MPPEVAVVIPTYNEAQNLEQIVRAVRGYGYGVVVVDDNSPDGTGEAAEELVDKYPVKVVHRAGKLGLGSAVMAGFGESTRPYLGVIDADLSHDPAELPKLIHGLLEYDITIGSRFGQDS